MDRRDGPDTVTAADGVAGRGQPDWENRRRGIMSLRSSTLPALRWATPADDRRVAVRGNERPPTVPLVRLTPRTVDAPTTVRLQGVGALAPRIDLACSEGMTARISSLSAGDRAGTVLPESMRRMVKVSARVARVSLFAAMVVLGLLGALLREMLRSLDQSDPSDPWGPHLSGF